MAGQVTAYTSLLLGTQYHTHAFFILIIHDYARLIRWDRSSAVITAPIYYDREPHLFNFLIRYNVAGEETCGHDSTICPFTPDEGQPSMFTKLDNAKQLLSITIDSKRFIVPSPSPRPDIPVGCWTQVSIAYNLQRKKCVLIKDFWQLLLHGLHPEGEIYRRLHDHSVPNIPQYFWLVMLVARSITNPGQT